MFSLRRFLLSLPRFDPQVFIPLLERSVREKENEITRNLFQEAVNNIGKLNAKQIRRVLELCPVSDIREAAPFLTALESRFSELTALSCASIAEIVAKIPNGTQSRDRRDHLLIHRIKPSPIDSAPKHFAEATVSRVLASISSRDPSSIKKATFHLLSLAYIRCIQELPEDSPTELFLPQSLRFIRACELFGRLDDQVAETVAVVVGKAGDAVEKVETIARLNRLGKQEAMRGLVARVTEDDVKAMGKRDLLMLARHTGADELHLRGWIEARAKHEEWGDKIVGVFKKVGNRA